MIFPLILFLYKAYIFVKEIEMGTRHSNALWGTFLLLAAAFLLINQLYGFARINPGSIIIAILALAFIVQSLARLSFASLLIPIAVLYIIFRAPLHLPHIQTWTLILTAILASAGLAILYPHKNWRFHSTIKHHGRSGDNLPKFTEGDIDNNPSVSVNFSSVSRRIHANNLETVQLSCNFGEMEIFLDQAELAPTGAEIILNCSFGAIKLYIPRHWKIIDRLSCSLGGVDIERNFTALAENAPQVTLTGSVSFGGVEIRFI